MLLGQFSTGWLEWKCDKAHLSPPTATYSLIIKVHRYTGDSCSWDVPVQRKPKSFHLASLHLRTI